MHKAGTCAHKGSPSWVRVMRRQAHLHQCNEHTFPLRRKASHSRQGGLQGPVPADTTLAKAEHGMFRPGHSQRGPLRSPTSARRWGAIQSQVHRICLPHSTLNKPRSLEVFPSHPTQVGFQPLWRKQGGDTSQRARPRAPVWP